VKRQERRGLERDWKLEDDKLAARRDIWKFEKKNFRTALV
jgi:hypothetical protein